MNLVQLISNTIGRSHPRRTGGAMVHGKIACLVLGLLTSGCASALKEPPPVTEIGPRGDLARNAPRSAQELIVEADLEMSALPDAAAIERARSLFLEAATGCEAPLESYLGAARATAWLVEHVDDPARREELATEGVQIGQLCRQMHPDAEECRYRLALAVGQQARERPATALDGLDVMVSLLEELINDAPDLDRAGPHRVLAMVLLRAPGWPSGPGDPELGLEHARDAVTLAPEYAPNHIVLGEALADTGGADAARTALERGLELARAAQASGDREAAEWIAQGREALDGLR